LLFDVILAEPKSRGLTKTYYNAIRLLEKPTRLNLIEQSEPKAYSEQTIQATLF